MYLINRYSHLYTLSKKDDGAELEVLQYYSPKERGKKVQLDKKYTINLSGKEWRVIKNAIDTSCYWTNEVGNGYHTVLDGGSWRLEGFDPSKRNCANRNYHVDICLFGTKNNLGNLCLLIRKFAKEERLNLLK